MRDEEDVQLACELSSGDRGRIFTALIVQHQIDPQKQAIRFDQPTVVPGPPDGQPIAMLADLA